MNTNRTPARIEFLVDVLTTAIENYGYGQFETDDYKHSDGAESFATIRFYDDPENIHRVTLDTLAHGLTVIRDAVKRDAETFPAGDTVLHNAKTGQRLYMSSEMRANILLADHTNGDDGDLDVVDALAILECALFGAVTYC